MKTIARGKFVVLNPGRASEIIGDDNVHSFLSPGDAALSPLHIMNYTEYIDIWFSSYLFFAPEQRFLGAWLRARGLAEPQFLERT